MYNQGALMRSSINLPPQNLVSAPQYSDYTGYPACEGLPQASGPWAPHYGDDWGGYGMGAPAPVPHGQGGYCTEGYHSATFPSAQGSDGGAPQLSSERDPSFQWMKKSAQSTSTGKTRTKDKYRVVYTDHQRLELEKEFHYNRYITIRRKSELSLILGLSERQVKIWFQNRRAKERKLIKRKTGQSDCSGSSAHSDPGSLSPLPLKSSLSPPDIRNEQLTAYYQNMAITSLPRIGSNCSDCALNVRPIKEESELQ